MGLDGGDGELVSMAPSERGGSGKVQVLRDPIIAAEGGGLLVLDPGQVLEWSGLGPASGALRVQTASIG